MRTIHTFGSREKPTSKCAHKESESGLKWKCVFPHRFNVKLEFEKLLYMTHKGRTSPYKRNVKYFVEKCVISFLTEKLSEVQGN